MYIEIAIIALFTFVYSVFSARIEKLPTSAPIIFVFLGITLGPIGLDVFKADVEQKEFRILTDLTLALILFIDAANANTSILKKYLKIPARMLLIGLPGAMFLGCIAAIWIFDLSVYEAAILGIALAATDAALGKGVVTNKKVPERLREGLNFESGLNDGLCVPFLLVFIALAKGSAADGESVSALGLVLQEIGIGAFVGLTMAGVGAWMLRKFWEKGWISQIWIQLSVPALAITCFAIAQSAHGSGYIAAFVGGLLFGKLAKDSTHKLVMAGEGIGEAMAMLTWMIFGVSVISKVYGAFSWDIIVYTLLSLTVIRVLPIFLSLTGTGESTNSKLFLGWFGPRGLASIVFAIIIINAELPGSQFIALVIVCTVLLSLVLHGITANPYANWIGSKEEE